MSRGGRPVKRSFSIGGHRTSVSLEEAFWEALREAARQDNLPVARLVAHIDAGRGQAGLSGAIRVWLLARAAAGPSGAASGQPCASPFPETKI